MDASHFANEAGSEPIGAAHDTIQSRQRWQHFIEASSTILYALRREGDAYLPVWVTDNVARLLGFSLSEMLDPWWWETHVHPDDLPQLESLPRQVTVGSEPIVREYRVRHAHGNYLWIRDEARLLADASGGVLEVVGAWTLIDKLKQTERALRFTQFAVDHSGTATFWCDADGRFVYVNETACRLLGCDRHELLCINIQQVFPAYRAEGWMEFWTRLKQAGTQSFESSVRRQNGGYVPVEVTANYLRYEGLEYNCALVRDITERRAAKDRFAKAFQRSPLPTCICAVGDGRIIDVNDAFFQLYGFNRAELIGKTALEVDLWPSTPTNEAIAGDLLDDGGFRNVEMSFRDKSGRHVEVLCSAVLIDFGGEDCVLAMGIDITERKALEAQLAQSRKMDAIGRLAGGIAHDFNNMLSVILSYSELLLNEFQTDGQPREMILEIEKAAQRSAALTRQLLTFGRKQIIHPQPLNLNVVVRDVGKLLGRLVGENIELRTALDPELRLVRADPGQMEQVVINLAINARDAMPAGGQLRIETHNVCPPGHVGNYVQLLVRDTGIGMDELVKSHIFEPFFTTKEAGKGTGLGLATVHGIVTQSGGFVEVESQSGAGATFKVYLPAPDLSQALAVTNDDTSRLLRGDETILLVEDEDAVRQLARTILEGRGFQVLSAPSGPEALEVLGREAQQIDLLLTDIVMPQMSGRQLAENALRLRPDLKVVFISGYESENDAIETLGTASIGIRSLPKPFNPYDLLRVVRNALDCD